MREWKRRGLLLIILSSWMTMAVADLHVGGVTGRAESGVVNTAPKIPRSSADFLYRLDATPEEDYQAGMLAYKRGELIEAQGIFERAANRGHVGAMSRFAEMLDRSGFVRESVTWYLKAAQLGDADAQYSLGSMMLDLNNYDLTKIGVKTDPIAARKWIMLAAEQGHPEAIKIILLAYVGGGLGLTEADRSNAEVVKWIDIAIDKFNDSEAMDALAVAYRTGKYGFEADPKLADEWAAKARKVRGDKEEEVKKKKKKRAF